MSFHGLITHFFLSLNNISLSGCNTGCLFIYLLRKIMVASKVWRLSISCHKHLCAGFWLIQVFNTPGVNSKKCYGKSMFSFVRRYQTVFQRFQTICIPISDGWHFLCFASSQVFAAVSVLNFGYSDRCVVTCNYYFNLYFPDDIKCLFTICLSSLERSLKVIDPLFN